MEQSVPKRRHIKFRRRGVTQKKAYVILTCDARSSNCTVSQYDKLPSLVPFEMLQPHHTWHG